MKKNLLLAIAFLACSLFSCSKGGDAESDCQDDNTTKVTFSNTGSVPLRVEVAIQLTPQYRPIDPVVVLDLAPGQSTQKEIKADQYFVVWSANCATTCTRATSYSKTYESCSAYEEKLGL